MADCSRRGKHGRKSTARERAAVNRRWMQEARRARGPRPVYLPARGQIIEVAPGQWRMTVIT